RVVVPAVCVYVVSAANVLPMPMVRLPALRKAADMARLRPLSRRKLAGAVLKGKFARALPPGRVKSWEAGPSTTRLAAVGATFARSKRGVVTTRYVPPVSVVFA